MSATMEVVRGDMRFQWTGQSHVVVKGIASTAKDAPDAMITVPEWVNQSAATEETLLALALLWLATGRP